MLGSSRTTFVLFLVIGLSVIVCKSFAQCQVKKITASSGTDHDWFGIAIAADEGVVVVAASGESGQEPEPRQAFVYEMVAGVWTQTAALFADDGGFANRFGADVSVSGDTILIGDNQFPTDGPGAAYIFQKRDGVWEQRAVLDGFKDTNFGNNVAVSGETAVVGASSENVVGSFSGAAYVFERAGDVWSQVIKLTPMDGDEFDQFGSSVAVDGSVIVVGAFRGEGNEPETGSAYVYERINGEWTFVAKLTADDGAASDQFGHRVGVSGQAVVVGAGTHDELGSSSGAAYVFEKIGGEWQQTAELLADDGEITDLFGSDVSISGSTVVVGSRQDDDLGSSAGAVYVFEKIGEVWEQTAKLLAGDGAAVDFFGRSVAISGSTIVAGANGDDDLGTQSGSAYVFALEGLDCNDTGLFDACESVGSGDFNADGVVDLTDWGAFVECMGGPGAQPNPPSSECVDMCLNAFDLDGNGTVDLKDVSEF